MSYNAELNENNAELQEILNAINDLPDAGNNSADAVADAVLYTAQALTDEQKAQARANIGAGSINEINEAVENSLAEAKESGEFDGTSVTVSKVTESTADGGSNVVTFSDGKTLTIKNGSKGDKGKAAYEYAQDGGYTGTEAQFTSDLSQIGNRADKDYLISVFEELKTAIAESNIDAAVAVLDKAILDLSTLS